MVPIPVYNIAHYIEEYEPMFKVEIPKKISFKNRIVSKGTLNVFEGKNLNKFVQMTVKGLNMYYYDFGIAYPEKSLVYPTFLYQIISAPKRLLVVVNYGFYKNEDIDKINDFHHLLNLDKEYSNILIQDFDPQEFLKDDVILNSFNGLVRTTDIDKAYERVFNLFKSWYKGLEASSEATEQDAAAYQKWLKDFKNRFYKQDYGFTAVKKFLGENWAKEVFENYIFY